MKVLILYAPVIHNGYMELFKQCRGVSHVFVVGRELVSDWDYIHRKDIRALDPEKICLMIRSLGIFTEVSVLSKAELSLINVRDDVEVVMPREDITTGIANQYLKGKNIQFIDIFLRWHRDNVAEKKKAQSHRSISVTAFDKEMMSYAIDEAQASFDWYRQVGGLVVKDKKVVLIAHSQHVPDEQTPYVFGDPRSIFKRGVHLELSSADHAEAILIGEAARRGISLNGAWLYVTDFPCPPCAKLVARAGFSRCYFSTGYAVLDGEDIMKSKGIELIFVEK